MQRHSTTSNPSSQSYPSSLMARLCSDHPTARHCTFTQLREDIRCNLERLLNSRQRVGNHAGISSTRHGGIAEYGIDDAALTDVSTTRGQQTLLLHIERRIAQFEPRLSRPRVAIVAMTNGVLHFRIEATLKMYNDDGFVAFDSQLDPLHKTLSITGAR